MKRRYARILMMVGVLTIAWAGAVMAGQSSPAADSETAVFTVA